MVSSSSWPLKMFSEISRAQFGSLPPIPKNRDPTTGFVTKREQKQTDTESGARKFNAREHRGKFRLECLGREKDLRVGGTSFLNCRFPEHNRCSFSGNRVHLCKFQEQCFNLTLLMRLGEADLFHIAILSRRSAKEKHLGTNGIEYLQHLQKVQDELTALETQLKTAGLQKEADQLKAELESARKSLNPDSNNVTEAIWFGVQMEASKVVRDEFLALDPKFLGLYRKSGSVNSVDQFPSEFYDTAWQSTFGKVLICGQDDIVGSSLSVSVSEHPQMMVSIQNGGSGCQFRAFVYVPHTGSGTDFIGKSSFPRHGYILDLPVWGHQQWRSPSVLGCRVHFQVQKKAAPTVRMIADEVFCRLPTMGAVRGVPWFRVLWPNTRCSKSESRTAGPALLP